MNIKSSLEYIDEKISILADCCIGTIQQREKLRNELYESDITEIRLDNKIRSIIVRGAI